ncbi:hypothetical protein ABT404_32260, partial [Streptomyces hyaluromycini]
MRAEVHEVGTGAYLVHGQHTNWVILKDGDAARRPDSASGTGRPATMNVYWSPAWATVLSTSS